MIFLCLSVMILYGMNRKEQAVLFQTAYIMPLKINTTYDRISLFVIPFEKKDLQCINFTYKKCSGLNFFWCY